MTPDLGNDSSKLPHELEKYLQQFEAIEVEAREILDGLTDTHLAWRPKATAWSIADCLDHLIATGRHSLFYLAEAVDVGRARGLLSPGPFRYGVFERWFVWLMEPPARIKLVAPRAYRPASGRPGTLVVAEFLQLQRDLAQSLRTANGLDFAMVKVRNPVSRWITFSLGQEFALATAHERRHLWQARRITEDPGFPRVERPSNPDWTRRRG